MIYDFKLLNLEINFQTVHIKTNVFGRKAFIPQEWMLFFEEIHDSSILPSILEIFLNLPTMTNITNRALISRLFRSAEEQLEDARLDGESWSKSYEAVQDLTVPEKMVYIIVKLNQSVTNGGFSEFYEASLGIFTPEIIHVLNEIKAVETAEIVSSSLAIVNLIGLLDDSYKAFVFNIKLSEPQRMQLYTCDVRYDQLQDKENLEDLLGDYLQDIIK